MSKYTEAIQRSMVEAIPAYINDKGQFIAGKVIDRYTATTAIGDRVNRYPILEIEAAEGTFGLSAEDEEAVAATPGTIYAIHAFRQIAKNEVETRDVQRGHEIVFSCNGRRPSKTRGHSDMFLYKIVILDEDSAEEPQDVPF
jgi:hypothetical protein